jgi:protein ImuB
LARWGIRTLADLAALPEIGLAERFGEEGVHLRRLALGQTQRVLHVATPENKFEKRVELDHPLELLEPLLFVLSSILNGLLSAMRRLSLAANRIHLGLELLGLELGAKSRHERILEFAAPLQDAAMLLKILQLDLEAHPAAAAICRTHRAESRAAAIGAAWALSSFSARASEAATGSDAHRRTGGRA